MDFKISAITGSDNLSRFYVIDASKEPLQFSAEASAVFCDLKSECYQILIECEFAQNYCDAKFGVAPPGVYAARFFYISQDNEKIYMTGEGFKTQIEVTVS